MRNIIGVLLQLESLQASIDAAYRECFVSVSFDAPPDVEGAEALAPQMLGSISEAAFAELGRTHPKVRLLHAMLPDLPARERRA